MTKEYRIGDLKSNRQSDGSSYHNGDMNTFANRVRTRRLQIGLTQKDLAKKAGLSQTTISDIERGRNDGSAAMVELAIALRCRAEWLSTGMPPEQATAEPLPEFEPGPDLPQRFRKIPVVGIAQLGPDGYWQEEIRVEGKGEGYVEFISRDPDAYVLRVRGNSMAPAIRSGWLVVVEPNGHYAAGDYVLICTRDGRCMIKELLYEREEEVGLGSVNEAYSRLTLDCAEIEKIHPVSAILPPNKFKPW